MSEHLTAAADIDPAGVTVGGDRPTPTALQIADHIIARAGADGQELDLPKLQALLYLSQAWSLAMTGQPMFDEPILAGPDGPFVESVELHYAATEQAKEGE